MNGPSAAGAATSVATAETQADPRVKEIQERCYMALLDSVKALGDSMGVKASAVMHLDAIKVMSETLPMSAEAMMKIPHVTKANFDRFGEFLLEVTRQYATELEGMNRPQYLRASF